MLTEAVPLLYLWQVRVLCCVRFDVSLMESLDDGFSTILTLRLLRLVGAHISYQICSQVGHKYCQALSHHIISFSESDASILLIHPYSDKTGTYVLSVTLQQGYQTYPRPWADSGP